MESKLHHPDLEQLLAYTRGDLDDAGERLVEAHIEVCQSCCQRLAQMPDDTIVSLLRDGNEADTLATYPSAVLSQGVPLAPESIPTELREHPKYQVTGFLGHGGMGRVYKAIHRVMNRTVALKAIKQRFTANRETVERFRREVQAAAMLSHPNIVTAYDAEQAGNLHFLVMEYVDGVDLHQLLVERGPLPVTDACNFIRQAALGLQHAFERGMVHRDIKPHNLILSNEGHVKILDFGLAHLGQQTEEVTQETPEPQSSFARQLTTAGAVMGTPDFIAPEQVNDPHTADIRADIYSLGCTFYTLLTGQTPFHESAAKEKLQAHSRQEATPVCKIRNDVPREVVAIIQCMMAKAPGERYQTPGEVVEALSPFIASTTERHTQSSRVQTRRRLLILTASVFGLITFGMLLFVRTPYGIVRVEINDPTITARLVGHSITIDNSGEPIQIEPGKHKLAVQRGGLQFRTDTFELRRREEVIVKVVYERGKIGVFLDDTRLSEFNTTFPEEPDPDRIVEIGRFEGHRSASSTDRSLAVSNDGRALLSGSWDKTVRLWSVETTEPVCHFVGHEAPVQCVALSPCGRFAASGDADGYLFLWEIATAKPVWRIKAHEVWVPQVVFSKDGSLLFSGGGEGMLQVREAATGKEIDHFRAHDNGMVASISFFPSGRSLIVNTSGPTWAWDLDSGKRVRMPFNYTYGADVSSDGKRLVIGHTPKDGCVVRLWDLTAFMESWDVTKLKELRSFGGHTGVVNSVHFLSNDRYIISGGRDGTIRIWDINTGRQIAVREGLGHLGSVVLPLPDGRRAVSFGVMYTGKEPNPLEGDYAIRLWQLPECVWPTASDNVSTDGPVGETGSDRQ